VLVFLLVCAVLCLCCCLYVLRCRQGFVPGDEELLSWLRRNNPRPLVIVANKADTKAGSNSA